MVTGEHTEDLRHHVEGVTRLARRLVGDAHVADDVTQETFLVLLRRRPVRVRDLGAWLRGVVRNKAREARRTEERRKRHEAASRGGATPAGPQEIAASLEVQERLLASVKALAEPYRTAIWLRFFEDRSAREIARAQGLPIETVRTHLKRGLARLRDDLDRSHTGGRAAWLAALLPLVRGSLAHAAAAPAAGATGAGALLTTKTVLAAMLLSVTALITLSFLREGDAPRQKTRVTAAPVPGVAPRDGERRVSTVAARAPAGAPSRPREAPAPRERPKTGPKAPAHDGTFAFHYKQGWSFRRRAVVPPEQADLVFETCAGGISSVTLGVPGGGIRNLELLRSHLPDLKLVAGLFGAFLRADTDTGSLAARASGDRRTPHSDVFLARTRRGEWVKLAIVGRGSEGGWQQKPVTIAYALQPERPVFSEDRGDLVVDGVEVDAVRIARLEKDAATEAERLRRIQAAPVLAYLEDLDREAATAEADLRARGAATHAAAVLVRQFALPLGDGAYTASTYSFDKATRDDRAATRNDWDLHLQRGRGGPWIGVRTVTDDRSVIRDLGALGIEAARRGGFPPDEGAGRAEAVEGHTYLIHTLDSDSDHWALLRVLALDREKSMLFEWLLLDDLGPLRDALTPAERILGAPRARIQIRGGAGGGNPHRVFLDGTTHRIEGTERAPLSMKGKPAASERHRAYVEGGLVPAGQVFLVESIEYTARADGDHNGPGGFTLDVGGFSIARFENAVPKAADASVVLHTIDAGREEIVAKALPVRRRVAVRIPIRRDGEKDVFVEVRNSSLADVILTGRFVPDDDALADPVALLRKAGQLRTLRYCLQRLADLADTEDAAPLLASFRNIGQVARPYLERVLESGARGAWRRRVETALEALGP